MRGGAALGEERMGEKGAFAKRGVEKDKHIPIAILGVEWRESVVGPPRRSDPCVCAPRRI